MEFEKHIFISDIHLGAFTREENTRIEQDLICLIQYAEEHGIALYILGDLFDYWMEYPEKGFVPRLGENVLNAFEKYNKNVKSCLYITGNHDNWTFGHFEERGFDLEPNFRLIKIGGKRFLLMHGDGVAASRIDFPRAAFHRLLRSDSFVSTYQSIFPPTQGLAAMKMFSKISRRQNYLNPEPLNRQAKKIFSRHNLDYILSGHDHIPREETFPQGTYINLGTFFKHRSLAVYHQGNLRLETWNAENNTLIPFNT